MFLLPLDILFEHVTFGIFMPCRISSRVFNWLSLRCLVLGINHLPPVCRSIYWTSSTHLTVVSKFKPHLPAQWAVGTHRKGQSRMEKVTSRMNWAIRNSTQIRKWIKLIDNIIMWSLSLLFIYKRFYRTHDKFGPLTGKSLRNFHGLSPWHRPCPALTSCGDL